MDQVKIDIGCGGKGSKQKGFIGIDLWPKPANIPDELYIRTDFLENVLFPENSVDEAIALHIIEHLDRKSGVVMIERALYYLKPGAMLSVTCPDFNKLCSAYMYSNESFLKTRHQNNGPEIWPGETLCDRVNWAIHEEGHEWSYDMETLVLAARQAGAKNIREIDPTSKYNCRKDHEIGIEIIKE